MESKYTAEDYIRAFRNLIATYHIKMFQTHYYATNRSLTASQMATAMAMAMA
jgi:hypothetical protein